HRDQDGLDGTLFRVLGGDQPGKFAAYVATGAIGLAFLCCLAGGIQFLTGAHHQEQEVLKQEAVVHKLEHEQFHADEEDANLKKALGAAQDKLAEIKGRWAGQIDWLWVSPAGLNDPQQGTLLRLGYRIDHLSVIMFLMVTFIATLIHLFSIGYMSEEL